MISINIINDKTIKKVTQMILRVRTQLGTWRLPDVQLQDTFLSLKGRIEKEHNTTLIGNLANDLSGSSTYGDQMTVQQANLKNGDMLFILVDETKTILLMN